MTDQETIAKLRADYDKVVKERDEVKHQYVKLHTAVANGLSWASTLDQLDALRAERDKLREGLEKCPLLFTTTCSVNELAWIAAARNLLNSTP